MTTPTSPLRRTERGELRLEHALGHHVTARLCDDRVMLCSTAARRAAARIVIRCGLPRGLLAFRFADNHLHMLTLAERATAGRLAHSVEVALRMALRLPVPFEPARIRPVADQRHLAHSLRYVLRQEQRHAVHLDPWHDASSLPDLLGLRVVAPGLARRVASALPRLDLDELAHSSGFPLVGGRAEVDRRLLSDCASAALGLPDLRGRYGDTCLARRAACHFAQRVGWSTSATATLLGMSARSVRDHLAMPPDRLAVVAIALQMRIRGRAAHEALSA